jgi:hypothetical protein
MKKVNMRRTTSKQKFKKPVRSLHMFRVPIPSLVEKKDSSGQV